MNLTISEVEKARKILSHCEEKQCAGIARMEQELETEEAFRAAIEAQCTACLVEEDAEVKNGEIRVSCLESENNVLRRQIAAQAEQIAAQAARMAAMQNEISALKAAWFDDRRELQAWRKQQ